MCLLKGYWQVRLSDGLHQCKVMFFGMKNASATFQRMIYYLEGCEASIDNVIIYSNTLDEHLWIIRALSGILAKAKLTVNLQKSDFCHVYVKHPGHKVGHYYVSPIIAKVKSIGRFSIATNKKKIMRFMG